MIFKQADMVTILLIVTCVLIGPGFMPGAADAVESDDTMLMFVGEELAVVTAASRFPESPSSAPAVVRVVNHEDIEASGFETLAEVLASEPGFYMADQGMGTVPWLRGIANGILVLYDGVPVPTGGTRTYASLDYEICLDNVKRVEIIRGPGSVLWGADAFAGIVNIVPFTGKEADGVRAEVTTGSDSLKKGFASLGTGGRNWDLYLSLSGVENRYHNDKYFQVTRGEESGQWDITSLTIDDASYYEVNANAHINDYITLSGRYSDFKKPVTLMDHNGLIWASEKKTPVNFIKANINKVMGKSHWNFTTYYQDITYEQEDAGVSVKEDTSVYYCELLWDHRFFQKGLLTGGVSYRKNRVDAKMLEGGFMPELMVADYEFFVQPVEHNDYESNLFSVFSQYRHQFSWGEVWLGGRFDDNSMYDDYNASYSLGVNLPLSNQWRIKTVMGTGYRTPYSKQVFEDELLERDGITTVNLQAEWSPSMDTVVSLTAFYNRISDHVQSDRYAGFSDPLDQDITGGEISFKTKMFENLRLSGSLTKMFLSGEDYDFSVLRSTYISPDGSVVKDYDVWSEDYNPGADFMVNAGLKWDIMPKLALSLNAYYSGPVSFSYAQDTISGDYHNPLLVNAEIRLKDLFLKGAAFTLGCKNILDNTFEYPGLYGPVEAFPLTAYAKISFSF
ncbi:MAG: TonB-dependent receptor plug domain-containing protein [Thermodesulfobacteriota bacterium]|nr:TonB-dependent receptor plug domain-containing protein [Thermodesulfobacteriota bacterium]